MIILETIAVAFAMFSAIPVPQPEWNGRNMRYALCAFPLIGLLCGLGWWGWTALSGVFSFPLLLKAGGLCLIPVLITGGIHLDGYADTCDALSSYADFQKKQEILKDPHCGAFALIRTCSYFIAYLALCGGVDTSARALIVMGLGFMLERSLSGLAIASFPMAKNTGLAHTFASAADKKRVRIILLILSVLLSLGMAAAYPFAGSLAASAAWLVLLRYCHVAKKQFGGTSGDLAGWFLQKAEIWMLAVLTACQMIGRVLL